MSEKIVYYMEKVDLQLEKRGKRRTILFFIFGSFYYNIYLLIHLISQASNDARAIDFTIFNWSVYVKLLVLLMLIYLVDVLRFYYILKTLVWNSL